jgi:hypothetical protein
MGINFCLRWGFLWHFRTLDLNRFCTLLQLGSSLLQPSFMFLHQLRSSLVLHEPIPQFSRGAIDRHPLLTKTSTKHIDTRVWPKLNICKSSWRWVNLLGNSCCLLRNIRRRPRWIGLEFWRLSSKHGLVLDLVGSTRASIEWNYFGIDVERLADLESWKTSDRLMRECPVEKSQPSSSNEPALKTTVATSEAISLL